MKKLENPWLARKGKTTKHAKSAKMATGKIEFKEESYQVIGACFKVYKEKDNRFRAFRVFRSFKILESHKLIQWTLVPCATDHGVMPNY